MSYTHQDITINQRTVSISNILQSIAVSRTSFENTTFTFIREWLSGAETFTLQTSGSTGTPKETLLTRNQLKQSALRTIKALSLVPDDIALVCLDTKYIAGKMMLVRALEGHMKIVAIEPGSNPLKDLPKNIIPGFTAIVPLQLQEILSNADSTSLLNKIKTVIIGGASVNTALEKAIQSLNCAVYATYGMTETVSHIALQRLNGKEKSNHFTVLQNILIEKDERGCLVIHMPELEEKVVTNDLVELINDKNFCWLGRWDMVVNSGGFKISPEKVEHALHGVLETLAINKPFFVTGISDEKLGHMLVVVFEGDPLTSEIEDILIGTLKGTLHAYEVPKKFLYAHCFMLTETGKINRTKTILSIQ